MNKNVFKLITISTLAAALAACGGGSSSSSGPSQVTQSPVTPPSGAESGATAQSNGSSVYQSGSAGAYQFYFLGGATESNPSPTQALAITSSTILGSYLPIESSTGMPVGNLVVAAANTAWLVGGVTSVGDGLQAASVESTDFTGYTSTTMSGSSPNYVVAINQTIAATGTSAGFVWNTFAANGSLGGAESVAYTSCVSAGSTNASSTTAISSTTISGSSVNGNYIAIGTNKGDVCVYGLTGSNAGNWKNLTESATASTFGYSFGTAVNGLAFTQSSSNDYGYFYLATGTIYRVIANNSTMKATSFTNLSQLSGAPTVSANNIISIYSDVNNNLFVGTYNGYVYSLQAGQSSWTKVQLASSAGVADGGRVTGFSIALDGTVVATTSNGNSYYLGL